METLKFLMISTHYPPHHLGGDAVFVEYLSEALVARGHAVHVVCNPAVHKILRGNQTEIRNENRDVIRHPIVARIPRINMCLALSLGLAPGIRKSIDNLANQLKPDIVHWHNTKGFVAPPTETPGAVSLYTAHDYYAICPRSNLLKPSLAICTPPRRCQLCHLGWKKPMPLWRLGRRRVLEFSESTRILCPSDYVAKQLSSDGVKVHSVLRNFVPDPGMTEISAFQDNPSILYLGMLELHKGVRTLIEAFSASKNEHGFILDIVGEGSLKSNLSAMVSRLGLGDRIRIHGFISRDQLAQIRRSAIAQIVPSEWPENAPLSAIEAMAMGTPIIGSDMGGLPEILNKESGHLEFRAKDIEGLAKCIISMWSSRGRSAAMSSRVRMDYDTRFTPEIHLTEYLERARG